VNPVFGFLIHHLPLSRSSSTHRLHIPLRLPCRATAATPSLLPCSCSPARLVAVELRPHNITNPHHRHRHHPQHHAQYCYAHCPTLTPSAIVLWSAHRPRSLVTPRNKQGVPVAITPTRSHDRLLPLFATLPGFKAKILLPTCIKLSQRLDVCRARTADIAIGPVYLADDRESAILAIAAQHNHSHGEGRDRSSWRGGCACR
jgi:hypothetical protein